MTGAPPGVALWSSGGWRDEAVAWVDDRLEAAGARRTGDAQQAHLRPWATVLRVPTTNGTVWFKAAAPATAFEIGLYEVLTRTAPAYVLSPIAGDQGRASRILLPDGGPPLAECCEGVDMADALVDAIVHYGALQREVAPHVDEMLAIGVPDMRPAVMPARFEEVLDATAADIDARDSAPERAMHARATRMRGTVASWCDELAESRLAPSLDHNDLHPWNVLGDGRSDVRFYDWGDSVVAHPFAAMLVPLQFVQRHLDVELDDPRFVRACEAYVQGFAPLAPGEDLLATLEVACRVAKVARVLTWVRALRTAREQSEEVEEEYADAPVETLASLLDDSYIGGA